MTTIRISNLFWRYTYDPANLPEGGGEMPPVVPPPFVFIEPSSTLPVTYVIYIGDQQGHLIGEIPGIVESVAWAVDGYGMATILLSPEAASRYARLIRFGYRIRIEFSNGVRHWGGIIDAPRETTRRQVRLTCYEPAYMLNWRLTDIEDTFDGPHGFSPISILATLIRRTGLGITRPTRIANDDDATAITFREEPILAAAKRLMRRAPHTHFRIETTGAGGGRIGFELTALNDTESTTGNPVVLIQDYNLKEWSALRQGPIFNEIHVVAGASTFVSRPETRLLATAISGNSVWQYDLRQRSTTLVGVSSRDTTQQALDTAAAELDEFSAPRLRVKGVGINCKTSPYQRYNIGQRVRVELYAPESGIFLWTILGMAFSPGTGAISLVLDDNRRASSS